MEKIGILIDSTTLTRKDLLTYDFVKVAQLKVHFDDEHYDESELTKEEMQEKNHHGKHMLTSQPSPQDFLDKFDEFHKEGYTHVIGIFLTKGISGTYQSSLVAKSMIESPLEVECFSPEAASFGVALGIKKLAEQVASGTTFKKILDRYHSLYKEPHISFTLGDLMNLFRGGRLSRVSALIGKILRIKPIIKMIEGKLQLVKRERTNKACMSYFMTYIEEYVNKYNNVYLDIIYINMTEWGEKLKLAVEEKYQNIEIHMTDYLSPVFYTHLGNKGFGIAILGE